MPEESKAGAAGVGEMAPFLNGRRETIIMFIENLSDRALNPTVPLTRERQKRCGRLESSL